MSEHCKGCLYYREDTGACDHSDWDYEYPLARWILDVCDGEGMRVDHPDLEDR